VPVLIIEREDGASDDADCVDELRKFAKSQPFMRRIEHMLVHPRLPVDVRHNAKINREMLADWAACRLPELR
jgi:hypothetical protein